MTGQRTLCALILPLVFCISAQANLTWQHRVERVARFYATTYSIEYWIPVKWVRAIIRVESNWNPAAISHKGAMGIMQLMPETAARYAVRNPYNVEQNIRGGVQHLAFLLGHFKGDLRLATAAYYAGEGPIAKRGLNYCSPEVVEYVKRVADIYRAPRHGELKR